MTADGSREGGKVEGGRAGAPGAEGASPEEGVPGSGVSVVLVTAPNAETAEFLAKELVEERLAACASVITGLVSLFWWEGEVQRDDEALVLLKTRADGVEALRDRVVDLHPYEVPEFLALPVEAMHGAYGRWIAREVKTP